MSSDVELYGGGGNDLQPYSQPLAPAPSPDWGGNDVDTLTPREVDEYQGQRSSQVQLFGQPMPPGTTPQQIQAVLGEIGGVYLSDFSKLGHPNSLIQSAIQFFMTNATKPPQQVTRHHSFNLHNQAGDWLAESFGNFLHSLNGTQAQKQKFLSDSLWWLGELNKKLGTSKPTAREGNPISSADPTANLTEAEFERVVKINDAAKAQTYGYLESLWGESFKSNLRMVDAYYAALPRREQEMLDVFTTGWIKALNTKEVILGLYKQAIGSHSMPSGGAVATEIAEHEHVMKTDRKRWMSDERLQARYRELLNIRDGH